MDDLLGRARAGERRAQQELFGAHAEGLYRYAFHLSGRHADAEDLVQETFLKALAALAGFRGECAFEGWLFRIAMNLYLNQRRARRAKPEAGRLPVAGGPDAPATTTAGSDEALRERVRAAVDRLPARQQEVILLHTYERMDDREIARLLECSYETVRMNLSHARKRLRELLADDLTEGKR